MKFFGYFKDGAIVQRSRPVLVRGRADGEVTCSHLSAENTKKGERSLPKRANFPSSFPLWRIRRANSSFSLNATGKGSQLDSDSGMYI